MLIQISDGLVVLMWALRVCSFYSMEIFESLYIIVQFDGLFCFFLRKSP